MSKIRSIEDYFVTKFNKAQRKIKDLKEENAQLKSELNKAKVSVEPVVMPELAVRYSVDFSTFCIVKEEKHLWAKAVENPDFSEIVALYGERHYRYGYGDIISRRACNAIIEVAGLTF